MSDYARDFSIVDDALLTPQMAARIWRLIPEGLRHRYMNVIDRADPSLHDAVFALTAKSTDAAPSGNSRRAGAASTPSPASTGE